jgi:hypothetical protein
LIVIEEEGVELANIEGLISIRFRSGQLKSQEAHDPGGH